MSDKPQKLFFHGKAVDDVVECHHHVSPVSLYVTILAALFVLTGLTYAVSYMSLGPASLTVAMIVAAIKATLVAAYFMHLKYDDRFHLFVFASTLLFVAIFFGFTMFDISTRDRLSDAQGNFVRRHDGGYKDSARLQHPPACTDGSMLVCDETFEPCPEGSVRRIEAGCFEECVDPKNSCQPLVTPVEAAAAAKGDAKAPAAKPAGH